LINALQDVVNRSKEKRDQGTTVDDLRRKNGLSKAELIIYELQESLGLDNPNFQAAANSFANEVIACAINAINDHEAIPTALVLAEWAAELPSFGQTRKWLMEEREKIFTWDPEYVPEDDPVDDLSDIEAYLESLDEEKVEIEKKITPKNIPIKTTKCPRCTNQFQPDDVISFTDFGVRCPHCNQSIVL
jgi:DNA-directed RNA polymerase subunit RPC12/RpoP